MAQEKILGNQLNIDDVAADLSQSPALVTDLIGDTSPQLGGDLDANNFAIRSEDVSAGNPPQLLIRGGDSTSVDNRDVGGEVFIRGGNNTGTGPGGPVSITAGYANSATKDGGAVTISAGNNLSSGGAGNVTINGGSTSGIDLKSAGNVIIKSGDAFGVATPAGDIEIEGGRNTTTVGSPATAYGGNVIIRPGHGGQGDGGVEIHHAKTQTGALTGEGVLRFARDNVTPLVGSVSLTIPADTVTHNTFTLPKVDGSNGDVLTTNGSGVMTFQPGGGASNNWLIANDGSDFTTAPTAAAAVGIYPGGIALGNDAHAYSNNSIAIGHSAATSVAGSPTPNYSAIAVGDGAQATGQYSLAIGSNSLASADYTIAVGPSCYAEHGYSVCLGGYCKTYASSQVNVGYGVYGDATTGRATFGRGNGNAPGTGTGQNVVTLVAGKCEVFGDNAMFVAPPYTLATLPTVVEGGMIYVTDADAFNSGVGTMAFGRAATVGSPVVAAGWIDTTTGQVLEVGGG